MEILEKRTLAHKEAAMTFDPFASIAIICVLLIILLILQAIMISKTLTYKDKVQGELLNKLMAKDFKDYTEGTHRIDMGIAALKTAAKARKIKPADNSEKEVEPDEVPVI